MNACVLLILLRKTNKIKEMITTNKKTFHLRMLRSTLNKSFGIVNYTRSQK